MHRGWHGAERLANVSMGIVGRISLRYLSEKYREAEDAAGSVSEPGFWSRRLLAWDWRCRRDWSTPTAKVI
jgi:hypothetical protein